LRSAERTGGTRELGLCGEGSKQQSKVFVYLTIKNGINGMNAGVGGRKQSGGHWEEN